MPFFVRDHLAATRHMTLEERGGYMDLLCHAWNSDRPLPKDPQRLAALMGCTMREFRKVWPAVSQKFAEVEGGYINPRLEAERQKSQGLRTKASEKAATAAQARWEKHRREVQDLASRGRSIDAPSNAPSIRAAATADAPSNAPSIPQALLGRCPPPPPSPIKNPEARAAPTGSRSGGRKKKRTAAHESIGRMLATGASDEEIYTRLRKRGGIYLHVSLREIEEQRRDQQHQVAAI